ncbi:MAG: orotidine-5'-phosphate decarboxylase [Deltaproteobacteria bacterium]|nr:orotidine-5'-phosphate decarboxylase [Deltaproteobacteria bacterium]
MAGRDRLAVALDFSDANSALDLAQRLRREVGVLKVGLELFIAAGPPIVRQLAAEQPVFLDLKLLDIPATVSRAARCAAALGARYLTVHADAQALAAAVEGAPELKILAVTVLTSAASVEGARSVADVVLERAQIAQSAGCYGVVCSVAEAAAVKAAFPRLAVVTPGIRPAGSAHGDQARVATPSDAITAGADLLVVGRPIRDATDPVAAAQAIVAEIDRVCGAKP